jgi:hypothetical protein
MDRKLSNDENSREAARDRLAPEDEDVGGWEPGSEHEGKGY